MTIHSLPAPPEAYQEPEDQLRDYGHYILLCLTRYVANHGHRMLQNEGRLSNLEVSMAEVRRLFGYGDGAATADSISVSEGWPRAEECDKLIAEHLRRVDERGTRAQCPLPIAQLRLRGQLTQPRLHLLMAALAPQLSVDLSRLYTWAWADFSLKQPTVGFLCELIADEPGLAAELSREFHDDAPLVRLGFLEVADSPNWVGRTPLLHRRVSVPERVLTFLRAQPPSFSADLAPICSFVAPGDPEIAPDILLLESAADDIRAALGRARSHPQSRPRLLLHGPASSGRRSFLVRNLEEAGCDELIEVDLQVLAKDEKQAPTQLAQVASEALLRNAMLWLKGDEFFESSDQNPGIMRLLEQVVSSHPGPVAFAASTSVPLLQKSVDELYPIGLELLPSAQQATVWSHALRERGVEHPEETCDEMASRFNLPAGSIVHVVEDACTHASVSFKRRDIRIGSDELTRAVRRRLDHALTLYAEQFTTRMTWDDVVLAEETLDVLREIELTGRHRRLVYDEWGFGDKTSYGNGLACLFTGPPGTGKTMMAGIIAKKLGRELYKVDISRIASKWVGESQKNLAKLFDEAQRAQVILFFDEADSLFAKRTGVSSANDRYANMEVNFLLQRMESYDGVTILTTNFGDAIDDAFARRFKFRVHFDMPDEALRTQLWQKMIPPRVKLDPDIYWEELGDKFPMSGGNIKKAIVRAAFFAADRDGIITEELLMRAARGVAKDLGMLVQPDY